ncbi:TPA: hypothetical protein ACH3X2_007035 [Trebouxia sp. C0005]
MSAQHGPAGKTTLLRGVVGLLANTFNKRVVVVDTSNEIEGDGAVPHSCLGKARCMPVHDQSKQHEVLLQAVQNHNPQVIVVDEIGSADEEDSHRQQDKDRKAWGASFHLLGGSIVP